MLSRPVFKALFVFSMLSSFCKTNPAYAENQTISKETSNEKLAFKLVSKFWKAVERQDVKLYTELLAPHFQGINIAGIYTRSEQITGLKNLTVTSFKLENLKASSFEDTLVISYDFHAHGHDIVSGPCIDIWHKKHNKWKQISHTYVPFQK